MAEKVGSDNNAEGIWQLPGKVSWLLVGLLCLSVLLRVGVALYLGDRVPPPENAPDDTSYSYLSARLASGYGYSFDRPWYPFGKPAGYPTAHWSFLYTAFVAGVYLLFGVHPLAVRLISAVLGGLLLPFMTYRFCRRLFPSKKRVAVLAAGCVAFYAYFVLYSARLMTETFFITALLWVMERALALAERPILSNGLLLGLSLGISVLLRQSVLPWAVVLFMWLVWTGWRARHLWRMVGMLVPAGLLMILCILPFTVRNYLVYDDFLLLNSNAGYAMYSAQHPMHGTSFHEHAAAPLPPDLVSTDLSEPQLDRALMRRGIDFVLADPGRYLMLSLSRVWDLIEFWPTPDSTPLYNVGRVISIGIFLPFMIWGLGIALRQSGRFRTLADWGRFSVTPLALVLLFILVYSILHILTWAMPRYRLPIDAVNLSYAALALDQKVLPAVLRYFKGKKR